MDGFWTWPPVLQSAVFGALGGLAGALIAALLRGTPAFAKSQNVTPVLSILCIGLALVIGNGVASPYRHAAQIDAAMAYAGKNKLFAALFKYHPESRAALRARLMDIPLDLPRGEVAKRAMAAGHDIVSAYLPNDVMNAPADAVHGMLAADMGVMTALQSYPQTCVDFALDKPLRDPNLMTSLDLSAEADAKAAVIEGAALRPSPPPGTPDIKALVQLVVKGFRIQGYDLHDLAVLGHLEQAPPDLGCKVSIEYTGALVALPDDQAAAVVKGFAVAARHLKPASAPN